MSEQKKLGRPAGSSNKSTIAKHLSPKQRASLEHLGKEIEDVVKKIEDLEKFYLQVNREIIHLKQSLISVNRAGDVELAELIKDKIWTATQALDHELQFNSGEAIHGMRMGPRPAGVEVEQFSNYFKANI